jgi:transposase InsO family protein
LCKIAGISKSTYYRILKSKDRDKEIKEEIRELYFRYNGIYGYRRITTVMKRKGKNINHKKVYRLMKELELFARIRKKNYIRKAMMKVQFKGMLQDNGPAENFFSHFKEKMVKINKEKTKEEYKKLIEEYIKFYNEERYQARLKNMAPKKSRSHAV